MVDPTTIHQEAINIELLIVAVETFASMVDNDYENEMIECVGYSYACKELLPISHYTIYYEELGTCFPLCHFVFATTVSSSYFTISTEKQNINKDEMTSQAELHKKHRMILFVFCGLLCAKSRDLLTHLALCKPLGYFFEGFTQPSRKLSSGGFISTLDTCWKMHDKIHKQYISSFHEVLQKDPKCHVCFDNYNNVLPKKDQTAGKSATTHIGTAFMLCQDKPIHLPNGTMIKLSGSIFFYVISCEEVSLVKWEVKGNIIDSDGIDRSRLDKISCPTSWE